MSFEGLDDFQDAQSSIAEGESVAMDKPTLEQALNDLAAFMEKQRKIEEDVAKLRSGDYTGFMSLECAEASGLTIVTDENGARHVTIEKTEFYVSELVPAAAYIIPKKMLELPEPKIEPLERDISLDWKIRHHFGIGGLRK